MRGPQWYHRNFVVAQDIRPKTSLAAETRGEELALGRTGRAAPLRRRDGSGASSRHGRRSAEPSDTRPRVRPCPRPCPRRPAASPGPGTAALPPRSVAPLAAAERRQPGRAPAARSSACPRTETPPQRVLQPHPETRQRGFSPAGPGLSGDPERPPGFRAEQHRPDGTLERQRSLEVMGKGLC